MNIALIDREIFFGNPEISGAQISPDGEFISFIRPYKGVRNIWLKKVAEPFSSAKAISNDLNRPIGSYFWSRNSNKILYVQDKGGDENFHLFAIDVKTAFQSKDILEAQNLTPIQGIRAMILRLAKKDRNIIFVGLNDRNPKWHDVYKIDINTGERQLILQNDLLFSDVKFDLEDKIQVLSRTTPDAGTELLKKNAAGEFESFLNSSFEEQLNLIKINKDGNLYLSHNLGNKNLLGLYLYSLSTGVMSLEEEDPLSEVDLHNTLFSNKSEELLATVYFADKPKIYWKNNDFESDYIYLREKLETEDIHLTSGTEDENLWIVYAYSDTDPGAAFLYNRTNKSLDFLYRPRPDLPTNLLCQMNAVRYKSLDGLEIQAYLSIPKTDQNKKLPAVILVHGGPWARDYWAYNSWVQFLCNRGYVVIQPNFRGSIGFGKSFLNAGNGEWGEKMQDDISAAAHYLINEEIADENRIAVMGGSYGGYAALAGLTFTPEIYRCGISIVGPSNLFTLLESIPPYWEQVREMFYIRMGNPNTEIGQEQLRKKSPLFHAHQIKAPLLVGQGNNDPRVKTAESNQIAVAMRDNKLSVEYLNFLNEGHGFVHPDNNMAFLAVVEKFLAEHIGGRYQEEVPQNLQEILTKVRVNVDLL